MTHELLLCRSKGTTVFFVDRRHFKLVRPEAVEKEEFERMMMEAFVTVEERDNYRVRRGC